MRLTKKAIKDHGPCDRCGYDIVKGMSYWTMAREVRGKEPWSGFNYAGRRMVTVKIHRGCRNTTVAALRRHIHVLKVIARG